MRQTLAEAGLYGILDLGYVDPAKAVETARLMLEGGVQVLQLRAKTSPVAILQKLAGEIAPICRQQAVPFLLNDHPELVQETGADGAHVGQDDMTVAEARALAGDGALIGKSTHSLAQAIAAQSEEPDYLGFGPLFATPTKPDYQAIGLDDIAAAHRLVSLPIFCIGGIKRENLPEVLSNGARRVVVVSGILQAADIRGYCRDCLAALAGAQAR